jgi:hypothetical protein
MDGLQILHTVLIGMLILATLMIYLLKLEQSKERLVDTLFESLTSLYHLRPFTLCQNLFEGKVHVVIFHLKCLEVLHLCSNEFVWSLFVVGLGFSDIVDMFQW